mmetsp:Transcript_13864/g.31786  ORF Transcript_13864/g.31786 Transcript_13864/m.31786 type:complete len:236 (-) Transcript_13864:321-1028(-)|eukprot:198678_1
MLEGVRRLLDAVHLSLQVSHGGDQPNHRGVVAVEVQCRGEALRGTPEKSAVARPRILGECVRQLRNLVVKVLLEPEARPPDAVLVRLASHRHEALVNALQLLARLRVTRLLRVRAVLAGALQVQVRLSRRLLEHALKLVASPREAVVDVVRERVQRAHRRLLLRRIAACAVVLRLVREHHLRVALRAKRAALEKRLGVVNAAAVNVKACVDVVERIHHNPETFPEGVVEHRLRLG